MKKLLSILLVLVMVLSTAVVVTAETTSTNVNLIGVRGSYDVATYPRAFSTVRTPVQSGDTVQADNLYTAEELANTIAYNKTGAGYGQWLSIDPVALQFTYATSEFVINDNRAQSSYGVCFDENLKLVRAVKGFEVGKYYMVSFDLLTRFDITGTKSGFKAGVVGEADLLNNITLNGGTFSYKGTPTRHYFVFYADNTIVDKDGYAYLMFQSEVNQDTTVNNFSIVECDASALETGWTNVNDVNEPLTNGKIYKMPTTFNGMDNVICMSLAGQSAVKTVAVEKNTNYVFTFKYYSENYQDFSANFPDSTAQQCVFETVAVGSADAVPTTGSYVNKLSLSHYSWGFEGSDLTVSSKPATAKSELNTRVENSKQWNTFSIKFNSADLTEVKLILNQANFTDVVYITDVKIYTTDNTTDWKQVNQETGDEITSGSIYKAYESVAGVDDAIYLNIAGQAVVKTVEVEKNTNYIFSFKYYSENYEDFTGRFDNTNALQCVFESVAVGNADALPKATSYENKLSMAHYSWGFEGSDLTVSSRPATAKNELNTRVENAKQWNTFIIKFNSADLTEVKLILNQANFSGAIYIADVKLEADHSLYFENPDNWVLSLTGEQENRRNISTDGTDGTYFSGEKGSAYHGATSSVSKNEGGSSIKLIWASHASNIALPNLEKGKTYRLKFSYKVVTDANTPETEKQLNKIGVYSPTVLDNAINNGNTTVKFNDGTVGWNVADYFKVDGKYRYRDESLQFCFQTDNRYDNIAGDYSYAAANAWYDEELYFTVNDYTDLYLVILPGNNNKGGMFLDEFEFEEVKLNSAFVTEGENTPVSMRKATDGGIKQAIRYKFGVDNNVKANGISGYELVEYGAVAASDTWLAEGELPEYDYVNGVGKTTELNKKTVVGVSYNKNEGKDIAFEVTDGVTVFSAALYNIGMKNKITDYYEWNTDYVVRPYAVYYNNATKHTVMVYGDEAYASVFDVMNAILTSTDITDEVAADKAYIEDLFASNSDILSAFIDAGYSYNDAASVSVQKKNNG